MLYQKCKDVLCKGIKIGVVGWLLLPGQVLAEQQPVVSVNNAVISSAMINFLSDSREQGPLAGLEASRTALVDRLIDTELLFQAAKRAKLEENPEILLELELARKTLLSQLYVARYMDALVIDEATLQAAYDGVQPEVMVQMDYWSFATREAATTFLNVARHGDNAELHKIGRTEPWQRLRDYPFARMVEGAELAAGDWIVEPTQHGAEWRVWRCHERSAIPKPSFADAREGLRQELAHQHLQHHLETLRAQADIERY